MQYHRHDLYGIVAEIIDAWDPMQLFPMAPKDEYASEIKAIGDFLFQANGVDENQLAAQIRKVFSDAFSPAYKGSAKAEAATAKQILRAIMAPYSRWMRWAPTQGTDCRFAIDSVKYDAKSGLVLFLRKVDNLQRLKIVFGYVEAWQSRPESYLSSLWTALSITHSSDFYGSRSLFDVENSDYRSYLEKCSSGLFNPSTKQYTVFDDDDVIDILTIVEPKASWE